MGIDVTEARIKRELQGNEESDGIHFETKSQIESADRPSWISEDSSVDVDKAIGALKDKLKMLDIGDEFLQSGKNDGILSQNEMLRGLKELSSGHITEDELKAAKSILPKDGIPVEDFVSIVRTALKDADKNRDGVVDPKEMPREIAREMAKAFSDLPSR